MAKRIQRSPQEQELFDYVKQLSEQMEGMRSEVLNRASELLGGKVDVYSLHGKIGGKFNTYTNVMQDQFPNCRKFQDSWFEGLYANYNHYKKYNTGASVWDIVQLVKDDLCLQYILLFIERNFYKYYEERVRQKPEESLWELWFGGNLLHGLLIAPAPLPDGSWRVDHSEIRKVPYQYWTIGHVLHVGGIIDAKSNKIIPIRDLNELENYYTFMIQAQSKSQYEIEICKRYVDYLTQSNDFLDEPFLIPELRYAGKASHHQYRLDFTILNPHTMDYVGFELSPTSTHMHVSGASQTLTVYNDQVRTQWEKEIDKRNEYFRSYGITTVTFTDSHLKDIDKCFSVMAEVLSRRAPSPQDYNNTIQLLRSI